MKVNVLMGCSFAAALLLNACKCAGTSGEPSHTGDWKTKGVVVESVGGSAIEKAGIQAGDVLFSWKRLPCPPSNPEAVEGSLGSYFDWLELRVEQASRGVVVLGGKRGGKPQDFRVEPGLWHSEVRPVLPGARSEEIYSTGNAHLNSGDVEAAVKAWHSLNDSPEVQGDEDLQVWVAFRMGKAWGERGDWEQARVSFLKALEAGGSPSAQIATWDALGNAYERLNELEAADDAYLSALGIRQKLQPESLGVATSLLSLGSVAWNRGELDRAQEFSLRSLSISQRLAPQSLEVADSLGSLGLVARDRGELDRAQDYIFQALRIHEQLAPLSLNMATNLNNLGAVARARGELDQAHDYHLRALQIREQLAPQSLEVAYSLNHLGGLADERGELDRAYDFISQALRIQEKLAPESLDVAASLNNLGIVTWTRGELDRAKDYHLEALRIREKLAPQSLDMAMSLNNLGSVAKRRGELDRAHDLYLRTLQIEAQLAPLSLKVAMSLHNLGSVAWARGELERANDYDLQALQIREKLAPGSLYVAASMNQLAGVAYSRGELDRAHDYNLQALEIREELAPQSLNVAVSLNNLGDIARDRGELDRAYEHYTSALSALEHQVFKLGGSYKVQAGFRAQYDDYYHDTMDLLLTQSRYAEAFHVLERFRARTFLAMLAERDTTFSADISEQMDRERRQLAARYDRTFKSLAGLNLRDHSEEVKNVRGELERLDDQAGELEVRIRRAAPRLGALQYPRPLDADSARQVLDPGTLLLSYAVGEESTALFALSRGRGLQVVMLPLGKQELRAQVKGLLEFSGKAWSNSSLGDRRLHRFQDASRRLYELLIEPVADRIESNERLLILPDGPLHVLPFAALVRSDAGGNDGRQYLVEWKPLHVALSATVFAGLKQRRRANREGDISQATVQLVALGDPSYPRSLLDAPGRDSTTDVPVDAIVRSVAERNIFDWQPLPHTRHEVAGIASLFPKGTVRAFLGSEALEERIKSLSPETRILHIAAHGHTDEHLASSSFLALTIPEDPRPEQDNGLLQVWEVFERVRLDADLVVLSACESGLGQEMGSEGLIGLTRAFQYAGARSVAASLWSVADQTTAELMIRFYHHLRSGLTKDETLRAAQMEFIRGPIEVTTADGQKMQRDASAPYYWAAFQIFGDWQ